MTISFDTSLDTSSPAELLSLVADGRLGVDGNAQTQAAWIKALQTPDCAAIWQCNQLIGDVLRQQAPAARGTRNQAQWLQGLQQRLSQEPQHDKSVAANLAPAVTQVLVNSVQPPAANDRFWKMVAGASSVFGVGAIAVALSVGGGNRSTGAPALAQSNEMSRSAPNSMIAVSNDMGPMIRDPRLMERMSQHRQFGSTGVHASTAFIRNATFEQVRCNNAVPAAPGSASSSC